MNKEETVTSFLDFIVIDVLSIFFSFTVSYRIKFGDFGFIRSDIWLPLLFTTILLNIAICLFSDPYSGILKRPYYEEIIHSVLLTFYNLFAASVIFYVFKIGTVFSRQTVLTMYGLYFLISLLLKTVWKKLILSKVVKIHNAKKTSLLIICPKKEADEIIVNACASDFSEYEIKGLYFTDDNSSTEYNGISVLKDIAELTAFSLKTNIEEILITVNPSLLPVETLNKLISEGIGIHISFDSLIKIQTEDRIIENVGIYSTLSLGTYSFNFAQNLYLGIKRVIDIICSVIGIILLIPLSCLVKIAYLLSGDSSPIFYKQARIGKSGKEFKLLKFRTMVPDADKILEELLLKENIKAEWEISQKITDDPRITKIGKILRKTSLDELPQLINVLRGDMSLVGPRPLVKGELEAHGGIKLYQMVKPGITGWWGCNGRSNISYRERLELEYYYIKNFSIYLDFLCIVRTVFSVLNGKGAQ